MTQTLSAIPSRQVFILRIQRSPTRGAWIVELQNVQTGRVVRLASLDALPGSLRSELQPAGSGNNKLA